MDGDDDSNAPEEFTVDQGIRQEEEIRKVLRENKTRVAREGKERRRKWAHGKEKAKTADGVAKDDTPVEQLEEAHDTKGMLPDNIVKLLAANEKIIFPELEEEVINDDKTTLKRKKTKNDGPEAVLLKDLPAAECLKRSMEFLKRRKLQVSRSSSVLKNSNQALRLCTNISKALV